MHTIVFAVKRLPHLTHEEYLRHYTEVHGPLARKMPGLIEYRQMPIRQDYQWNGQIAEYDSISIYVYESDEAAAAADASPQGLALKEDTMKIMDFDAVLSFPGLQFAVYDPLD